jgi:hypothetical protein
MAGQCIGAGDCQSIIPGAGCASYRLSRPPACPVCPARSNPPGARSVRGGGLLRTQLEFRRGSIGYLDIAVHAVDLDLAEGGNERTAFVALGVARGAAFLLDDIVDAGADLRGIGGRVGGIVEGKKKACLSG